MKPGKRGRAVVVILAPLTVLAVTAWTLRPDPPPVHPEEPTMSHPTGRENRLAKESSPYLLLHKNNPVDWYPWGEEALERARREGKPIFLSVGYSTCYWCHVMERESFSDPAIAELMNRHFVNVKVDREERPDLDEIYMTATQILTGQGGWPNSVFLTPDLEPFYAGTYFPPEDRYGRPGFASVLRGLTDAWSRRRAEVEQHAEELAAVMGRHLEGRAAPGDRPPPAAVAEGSFAGLAGRYDAEWGGFGGAPKFPSPSNLFLLIELAPGEPRAGDMLHATLDRMARGGIYDQLAGGFHRYATDREWKVPHFEKMLYDNGLLLELYAREFARTGDAEMARVAHETAEFLRREMTSPEGALWSAIDAETDGHEGAFYVWTRPELERVLGEDDFAFAAPVWGFAGGPFFEGQSYVLHLPDRLDAAAERRKMSRDQLLADLAGPRSKLLAVRAERRRPLTDDKVLADWNGMAIGGLATAGELLDDAELVRRAATAADFVLAHLRPESAGGGRRLLHVWRGGEAKIPAFLADYAYLVRGLLALHRAGAGERWLAAAAELTGEQIERLRAPHGGFYEAAQSSDLLFRSQDVFDGAVPSANAVAVGNLLELAGATGRERWWREAEAALAAFAPQVEQFPEGARMMALAVRRYDEIRAGAAGTSAEAPTTAAEGSPSGGEAAARPASATGALAEEAQRAVSVDATFGAVGEDGWRPFRLALALADGWHVNANPASDKFLIPTEVKGSGAELRGVQYPTPASLKPAYAERAIAVYRDEVELTGEVQPDAGADARLLLTYQACDDERCLPPVTRELAVE